MNKALETKTKLNLFLVSFCYVTLLHTPDMCKLVTGHLVSLHAWLEEPAYKSQLRKGNTVTTKQKVLIPCIN